VETQQGARDTTVPAIIALAGVGIAGMAALEGVLGILSVILAGKSKLTALYI